MWELARIVFLGTMAGVLGTGAGGILLGLGRIPVSFKHMTLPAKREGGMPSSA